MNDNEGFAIYAAGFTDDNYGKNVLTASIGSDHDIATGTAVNGANSQWAMKVSAVTSSTPNFPIAIQNSFDTFQAVPNEYTLVAKRASGTDAGVLAEGSMFKTTYQVYISKTQPTGNYSGQVKYVLVHPALHAAPDQFYGETLQSVTEWGYKVDPGQTVTISDARDGEEYTVARLADGNLWLTKNLRLDFSRANLTVDNTNSPTASFLSAATTAQSSDNWCTSGSGCEDQINYNTSNIGNQTLDSQGRTYDEYGAYYNFYAATAGNITSDITSDSTAAGDICPAGWHMPSRTLTNGSPNSWTGDYWELAIGLSGMTPDEVTTSNYSAVMTSENYLRFFASPNNFTLSGYYSGSTFNSRGYTSQYWTSSTMGTVAATFYMGSSGSGSPGYSSMSRTDGLVVRCIAKMED